MATSEEDRFAATLRQGLQLFEKAVERNEERKVLSGDDAFKLSDTFGFPLPLTQELAAEAGLTVDVDRFAELLEQQRTRARAAAKKVPIGIDAGAVPADRVRRLPATGERREDRLDARRREPRARGGRGR